MRIDQETIQQVLQRTDITEVVGDYVSLKKRGANMIACCPFHNEKTPSFYVSPVKQIYKCFGCGKSGDPIRFIMDIESLSYPEAIRSLAKKYGVEIQEREQSNEEQAAQSERESLYIVMDFARKYYEQQLWESETGQTIGLSYFKERGFNHATIKNFQLGYSPDGWDTFLKEAQKQGFSMDILEKAGLLVQKEGREPIDRFRGRVMFPIHNVAGKVIAFGARILRVDKNAPKYLNSPETPIYHKSHIVYGVPFAKQALRQEDNCFLVEGYTDVVSMAQAGVANVVASSGTSLTKEQIQLIRRFTHNITVLYDGDTAGIKASMRGIDLILEEGMNVKAVTFPEGDDPDSYVKKVGGQAFAAYIKEHAQDFISFKTELSLQDVGKDPIKRAELITDLVASISKVPDAIKRSVFIQQVATKLGIEEQILISESNKIQFKQAQDREKDHQRQRSFNVGGQEMPVEQSPDIETPSTKVTEIRTSLSYHEEECCRLLVCYGTHVLDKTLEGTVFTLTDYIFRELKELTFETPLYQNMLEICQSHYARGEVADTLYFTSNPDAAIQEQTISWLSSPHQLSENWAKHEIIVPSELEKLADSAFQNILRIKKGKFETEMKTLTEQLVRASTAAEQDQIMEQMMQVKGVIKRIAESLGTVVQ